MRKLIAWLLLLASLLTSFAFAETITPQINTPQIFKKDIILNAHIRAKEENIDATDDCALLERLGYKIKITPTEKNNIKITTYDDIKYMEAFLNGSEDW